MALRALARVNLAAIERNAARLRARVGPGTELCAVVKAQASGHGAVPTARAALAGGATRLAVATAREAAELREAGLTVPILIMGAISAEELPVALAAGAELVGGPSVSSTTWRVPRRPAGRSASTSSSTPAWAGWGRGSSRPRWHLPSGWRAALSPACSWRGR